MIYIWNNVLAVDAAGAFAMSAAAVGLASISGMLNTSDILQFFDHHNLSFRSQLINSKSRDLQTLLRYFNKTTTYVSNVLLLIVVFPIIFVSHSKYLHIVVFICIIYFINIIIIFFHVIIHFVSVIVPELLLLYSNRLYIDITISRSSTLFMNVSLTLIKHYSQRPCLYLRDYLH